MISLTEIKELPLLKNIKSDNLYNRHTENSNDFIQQTQVAILC